jgi:phage shock protein A
MNDLLKKLNVLVRAGLSDLREADRDVGEQSAGSRVAPGQIEHEVRQLRERVNAALEYEDQLVARAATLQAEVEALDVQADAALADGQDEGARRAVRDLQVAQHRLAMAESDLQEHRAVTQELILRVNELDAAAGDLKRAQTVSGENTDDLAQASQMMGDVLREMRERIHEMSEAVGTTEPGTQVNAPPPDDEAVDDDLARRRERLSKK